MDSSRRALLASWTVAAALTLLLAASLTGDGTWMGGVNAFWLLLAGALLVAAAVYLVHRWGRPELRNANPPQRPPLPPP